MSNARNLAWLGAGAMIIAIGPHVPDVTHWGVWFGLTFLLRGSRAMRVRSGMLSLAIALYVAVALANYGSIPVRGPLYLAIVAVETTLALVPFVLDRWIARRVAGWLSTLVFPMALVAQEFLKSRVPHGPGTWGSLAYTQYGNLPLMQLAAVTGIWGVSFMIAWFASTLSWAWGEGGRTWTTVRRPLVTCAGVLGAVTVAGALRVSMSPAPERMIRAVAVTFPRDLFTPAEMFRIADGRIPVEGAVAQKLARLHDWFFDNTEREARAGAALVAWPEMNFLVLAAEEPQALARAQGLAAKEHVYIAMGIGAVRPGEPRPFQNKTVLVDPSGRIVYSYLKSRPVIGWEEGVMQPGDGRLPVVSTEIGRVSTAICFDADHPNFARQVGAGEAELWILPANDWPAVKRIHFEMAAFRAVENGTPILRPASFGESGAFDPWGRVLGSTDHTTGAPTMVVQVPIGHVPTLYPRIGDLFAWLCVAGCVLAPVLTRERRRVGAAAVQGLAVRRG